MKYSVRENIGIHGISMQDGEKLYQAIFPKLLNKQNVELDFSEVGVVAPPFLNAGIGKLLRDIEPQDLNHYLTFRNMKSTTHDLVQRVINHAKVYYSDESVRNAVDAVIAKYANDDDD